VVPLAVFQGTVIPVDLILELLEDAIIDGGEVVCAARGGNGGMPEPALFSLVGEEGPLV
jgi:hypothetical protein